MKRSAEAVEVVDLTGSDTEEEGFASTLSVQHQEGDIKKLFQDEEGMLGVPLEIQYERMIDQSGMEFQILISAKIKK